MYKCKIQKKKLTAQQKPTGHHEETIGTRVQGPPGSTGSPNYSQDSSSSASASSNVVGSQRTFPMSRQSPGLSPSPPGATWFYVGTPRENGPTWDLHPAPMTSPSGSASDVPAGACMPPHWRSPSRTAIHSACVNADGGSSCSCMERVDKHLTSRPDNSYSNECRLFT